MKKPTQYEWLNRAVVCTGMVLLFSAPVEADYKAELIPFPLVTLHKNNQEVPPLERHGSYSAVNFFYTGESRQTRVLAEYFVDSEEQDMERLAVGWVSPEGPQLWFGRFHTALDQWNRKHHHGAYLQTTIHRPGLIEFEDSGGIIPAHATGISIETPYEDDGYLTRYILDIGLGPELIPGHLEALDILNPGEGEHKLSVVAAMSHHSIDSAFDDQGLFAGYVVIPSSASGIDEVTQTIVGGYINYSLRAWHVTASATWLDLRLKLTAGESKHETLTYGYLQPEYWFDADWTLYGRIEGTVDNKRSLYLQQIPEFVRHRSLAGVRYQLSDTQALKFELATIDQFGQRFHQAAVQWSAAIP